MTKVGKPRIMIVGCGDIGLRVLPYLREKFRIFAIARDVNRVDELRLAGAIPILADLDQPATLARLGGLASSIVHMAPPQADGILDKRTRRLISVLPKHANLVYVSTSGVYGDCAGLMVSETRVINPHNARAKRRVDAEQCLRAWSIRKGGHLSILRVPGIYAANRLPLDRIKQALPALRNEDDVYTNHIHADDLAHIIMVALSRGASNRIYHTVDDSNLKMGEYFDGVARIFQLPLPPRMPLEQLKQHVSPMMLSFMLESRRLSNGRMKSELGVRLLFPNVIDALQHMQVK